MGGQTCRYVGVAKDSELAGIADSPVIADSLIAGILVKRRALCPPGIVLAYPPIIQGRVVVRAVEGIGTSSPEEWDEQEDE